MKPVPPCQARRVRLVRNVARSLADQAVMERPEFYSRPLPSSTRRYAPIWPTEQQQAQPKKVYPLKQPVKQHAPKKTRKLKASSRFNFVFWFGVGMLLVVVFWLVSLALLSIWQGYQDDLHFGNPRTYQVDVRVGHDDVATPSHFMAINLDKQVIVLEFPGGDPSKAMSYRGPVLIGEGQEKTPVTLEFADINNDGHPDMVIVVKSYRYPWVNDGKLFHPAANLNQFK